MGRKDAGRRRKENQILNFLAHLRYYYGNHHLNAIWANCSLGLAFWLEMLHHC